MLGWDHLMALTLLDEHLGQVMSVGSARFSSPTISIRDLIRARVELEIERVRDGTNAAWAPVIPGPVEKQLNGECGVFGPGSLFLQRDADGRPSADCSVQIALAEESFVSGRYFILLDDRQADDLDEVIDLATTSAATFLLLTPLKGG